MIRPVFTGAIPLVLLMAVPAVGADLSIWARRQDLPDEGMYLAHNPQSGRLLIVTLNGPVVEWDEASTSGLELVPAANWSSPPYGCAWVPSRGTYLVADERGLFEVVPGVPGQNPPLLLDLTGDPGRPTGGMVQDGQYVYYKYQVTVPSDQSIHRVPLSGPVADIEYLPYSALLAAGGNAITLQILMDRWHQLYISLRGDNPIRGIYRWDETAGVLVPVVQQPQVIAYTGETLMLINGENVDAQDVFYFDEVYSSSVLRYDRGGQISTFVTDDDIRTFMGDPDMSVSVAWIIPVGRRIIFSTGNISGHVLTARISPWYSDFDDDGDSDGADTQAFVGRLTGPVVTLSPGDEAYDYDGDSHIDLRDFGEFQRLFTAGA